MDTASPQLLENRELTIGTSCAEMFDQSTSTPLTKRVLDLVLILIAAPLWIPVMAVIALGIKLVSPGPILFRQERIGHGARKFVLFKFRSMKPGADTETHDEHLDHLIDGDCPLTKLDTSGDPRIIPLGRLLRASGLDELPQIFNVFLGDMSLVGPRPCTSHEYDRFHPAQRRRFKAVPGITGFWQVAGKNKTTFSEMISMDVYYAENRSVWMDLQILLKTVPTILGQVVDLLNRRAAQAGSQHSLKIAGQQS